MPKRISITIAWDTLTQCYNLKTYLEPQYFLFIKRHKKVYTRASKITRVPGMRGSKKRFPKGVGLFVFRIGCHKLTPLDTQRI